jgi:integrase/recombinase XerD
LIAQTMLQGGKRVREVLSLKISDVNFEESKIRFMQSKTKGMHKEIVISYPEEFMQMIRSYASDREGHLFVTKQGRQVSHMQVYRTFLKAGEIAGLPIRITPHVLRASVVTYLKGQGFNDTDIMKVTGHASAEMVAAYDKSSQEDNITGQIRLI